MSELDRLGVIKGDPNSLLSTRICSKHTNFVPKVDGDC